VLTIEPGVTIFGGIAEYIAVNRGSRMIADGTASRPIIFTSLNDLNGGPDLKGQWGGIVLAGRAPINRCPPTATTFPANPTACEYRFGAIQTINWGGNAANDNSGILRYIQVKEAGYEVAPNEELNGITFGSVGNGTLVDFIQVHGSADDAVEFFGGTVNTRHLVLDQWDDDGYDTDEGYTGASQFLINYSDNPTEEDRCFEASSAGSTSGGLPLLRSAPKVSNFVCRLGVASSTFDTRQHQAIVMNSGTRFDFLNGVAYSAHPSIPCLDVDGASTMADPKATFASIAFACGGGPYRTTDNDQPNTSAAASDQPHQVASAQPKAVATAICNKAPGTAMRLTAIRSAIEKCMPTPNISRITPISASCGDRSTSATKPGVNGPTAMPASR
jgi:hypothetical protein